MDAIALISGGMDSAVIAGLVAKRHHSPLFLHFNYGQKTEEKELQSFESLCRHYHIQYRQVIHLDFFKQLGHSSLVDPELEIPVNQTIKNNPEIPTTYVPFRNGLFLAYAVALAEVHHLSALYIGAVEADSSGYPDCRRKFYDGFNQALAAGTVQADIHIHTPLIGMSKSEIVGLGMRLGVPFEYTWSCYRQQDQACGVCDSCLLRRRAFKEAGVIDPIPYNSLSPSGQD